MSKRIPKTSGTEWLYLSMASFNGSGYADKSSPENYYESYLHYKAWRREKDAVRAAKQFKAEGLAFAEHLVKAREAGHIPSEKRLKSFQAFRERMGLLL